MTVKIPRKLSKQQKLILQEIAGSGALGVRISSLSRKIAEELGEGHGDRIWDMDEQMKRNREETLEKLDELSNENGSFPDEESEEEANRLTKRQLLLQRFVPQVHRKKKLLEPSHRASFSRSLRRLEERGLIRRIIDVKFDFERDENGEPHPKITHIVGDGRTTRVWPTEYGRRVGKFLAKKSKI